MAGIKLAARLHDELGSDLHRQVDIFQVVRDLGLGLGFTVLKGFAAGYLPATAATGGVAGVLINVNHPFSKQRYSAAHELGHHLDANGELRLDATTEVLARGIALTTSELTVETFAAWFLMPRPLVNWLWSELAMPAIPQDTDIYRLSLALGTSYSATLTHLRNMRRLSSTSYDVLRKIEPRAIKRKIQLNGPARPRNDVWDVRLETRFPELTPEVGDELVLRLPENASTGFMWEIVGSPSLRLAGDVFTGDSDDQIGAGGTRAFSLIAKDVGQGELRLVYRRPWIEEVDQTLKFPVRIHEAHAVFERAPEAV